MQCSSYIWWRNHHNKLTIRVSLCNIPLLEKLNSLNVQHQHYATVVPCNQERKILPFPTKSTSQLLHTLDCMIQAWGSQHFFSHHQVQWGLFVKLMKKIKTLLE